MDVRTMSILFIIMNVQRGQCQMRNFALCQDSFNIQLVDGFLKQYTFPWLGFVQYIHEFGHRSQGKAPRVVLIQQQFALGTAADLLRMPKTYKLGNAIFGDYEREELDCGLKLEDLKAGARCTRAYLEIPIINVYPHPEFIRFGMENSIALANLLMPIKSPYMVPICLPTLLQRKKLRKSKQVYLVDYSSTIPVNFDSEMMALRSLRLYAQKDCKRHREQSSSTSESVSQLLCTTGCGVRPGAPIISNTQDGRIELIGLAVGGGPCDNVSMRNSLNTEPLQYVDVFPYVKWITNVITAFHIPKVYPNAVQLVGGGALLGRKKQEFLLNHAKSEVQRSAWNGRTFLIGNYCFENWHVQTTKTLFFYADTFLVKLSTPRSRLVKIQVFTGAECEIVCARSLMPNRWTQPKIHGVGTSTISIVFDATYCPYEFYFSMILTGRNNTRMLK